ncbi:fimbrial protein [uncultured Cedecea sp.]|uniref:fimbrial protein n=1 Tax=uncultured Cedecea sp. TaxID=988762 RepID=UPI00262F970B|nr:fimbrial protein [uncultured Cedecea sp.]
MKMKLKLLILAKVMLISAIVSTAEARCTRVSGNEIDVQIPTPPNIVSINDGIYPVLMNTSTGVINTPVTLTCTGPVDVTPRLRMVRNPITTFSGSYPHMQDLNNLPFFAFEMSYTSPNGEVIWFGGQGSNTFKSGTPFRMAEGATVDNPVTITQNDFNLQSIVFNGYQIGNGVARLFNYGRGGELNNIYFDFVDVEGTNTNTYNPFSRAYIYVFSVNFTVNTCAVLASDVYKNIQLGRRSANDFSSADVGGVTPSSQFTLQLRCVPGMAVKYRINATSDTIGDPSNSLGLIALAGASPASGFAIQLTAQPFKQANAAYTPVSLNQIVTSTELTTGRDPNSGGIPDYLAFDAHYYRTAPASEAQAGSANATATIDFIYP